MKTNASNEFTIINENKAPNTDIIKFSNFYLKTENSILSSIHEDIIVKLLKNYKLFRIHLPKARRTPKS